MAGTEIDKSSVINLIFLMISSNKFRWNVLTLLVIIIQEIQLQLGCNFKVTKLIDRRN